MILLDLSFAFDTCDHTVLLNKLREVGISHPIFEEYFKNRKQVTRVGKNVSEKIPVTQGLCQGAINSPTWYNIYTYDVKYIQKRTNLKMFADDSCILSIHHDVKTAVRNAQSDFINLQKYLYNNHIYLNQKKTEALVMGYKSKRLNMDDYKIYCHERKCLEKKTYLTTCDCHQIEYSDEAKYLGIIIDNEFKMKKHVYKLCSKLRILNYQLGVINAGTFPMTTKITLYFSLVDSLLRYGVTLYMYAPKYSITPLKSQQKRIVKLLFNRNKISCLAPEELSTFVLIYSNFFDEKFRRVTEQPYSLRNQRFQRSQVYTIQYGERILEYIIPTLLNKYCEEFKNETNLSLLKFKIKNSVIALQ